MKSKLAMLGGLMALASMQSTTGSPYGNDEIISNGKKPFKKPIPKGCKEYWFYPSGSFTNDEPRKDSGYVVDFYCVATSDKSAERKYQNFKTKSIPQPLSNTN